MKGQQEGPKKELRSFACLRRTLLRPTKKTRAWSRKFRLFENIEKLKFHPT